MSDGAKRSRVRVICSEHSRVLNCLALVLLGLISIIFWTLEKDLAALIWYAPRTFALMAVLFLVLEPLNYNRQLTEAWNLVKREFGGDGAMMARREVRKGAITASAPHLGKITALGGHLLVIKRTCSARKASGTGLGIILRPLTYRERTTWRLFAIRTNDGAVLLVDTADVILAHERLDLGDWKVDHILQVHDGDAVVVYGDWEVVPNPTESEHSQTHYRGQGKEVVHRACSSCVVIDGGSLTSAHRLVDDQYWDAE